jgi:glyoxylase-like metal-dependent hydrolase (beta-lactamase superfamily II)
MQEIGAQELKDRLEAGDSLRVLDIREADEYAGWHIHGSSNLPVYDALRREENDTLLDGSGDFPKDEQLVVVCRAGILSRKAAALLSGAGFNACSLSGGMRGWSQVWSEAAVPDIRFKLIQLRRNGKGCLSYFFGGEGQAAVVDPSVEIGAYLRLAEREGMKISRVLETHVHADHLSRARELCAATGATLVLPANERVTYPYTATRDGDTMTVGGVSVETILTPGHTMESACYLLDGNGPLLTGDTLFVDAVGRPDLERGAAGAEAGARALYASLRHRLFDRFESVTVLPAHHGQPIGFGGEPIGSSLADIRPRLELLELEEEVFVSRVIASLQAKPPNHETIIAMNEGKAQLAGIDPRDLEAGPNRCAAG